MATSSRDGLIRWLRSCDERGTPVVAHWNAGGDETPVWFRHPATDEREETPVDHHGRDRELMALRRAIIETLDLPNAGESYHRGYARVMAGPGNAITMRVSSFAHCMNEAAYVHWEDDDGRLEAYGDEVMGGTGDLASHSTQDEVVVEMYHLHEIESVLHRADVRCCGRMDANFRMQTNLHVQVIDGDEVVVPAAVEQHYAEVTRMALEECLPIFAGNETSGTETPAGVYVEARLREGTQAHFVVVSDAYEDLRVFDDETVTLKRWE